DMKEYIKGVCKNGNGVYFNIRSLPLYTKIDHIPDILIDYNKSDNDNNNDNTKEIEKIEYAEDISNSLAKENNNNDNDITTNTNNIKNTNEIYNSKIFMLKTLELLIYYGKYTLYPEYFKTIINRSLIKMNILKSFIGKDIMYSVSENIKEIKIEYDFINGIREEYKINGNKKMFIKRLKEFISEIENYNI
ncbi:hypothetical protein SLOPH_1184, partial [Spraguea lophii 42_110]